MNFLVRLGQSAGIGAGVGLLWVLAYTPASLPLLPLLVTHAVLAVALQAALWVCGVRCRAWAPFAMGLVLALIVMPAWMAPFHDGGFIGGAQGYALDGLAVGLGGLCGVAGGVAIGIGGVWYKRGVAGIAVLLLGLIGSGYMTLSSFGASLQPRAIEVSESWPETPVAVIGIDGADWKLIDALIAQGELPNLAALIDEGRRGVLRSVEPIYSPVVWSSIFSGQYPAEHGLVDWYRADARNRKVPMLWDLYGAHGRRSITVNVPGSWPAARIEHGAMLAGFPIPGLVTGARGQMGGFIATTKLGESGFLATERLVSQGDDLWKLDVGLALPNLRPRFAGFRHALVDLLVRKQMLRVKGTRLVFDVKRAGDSVSLSSAYTETPIVLTEGQVSPWLRIPMDDTDARLRIHALEISDERVALYALPPMQTPERPRFPFVTGVPDPTTLYRESSPYIVEGLGWIAHKDARVIDVVADEILDGETEHLYASEQLLKAGFPDLFTYIITVTDRIQHPFWPAYEPEAYPDRPAHFDALGSRNPVVESWRLADEVLGTLLSYVPDTALVMLASDHGFLADAEDGDGDHRSDGIWLAKGPMIPSDGEDLEMSAADFVPTLLRCVGAPQAKDFGGQAHAAVCPTVPAVAEVATYNGSPPTGETQEAIIDSSREEQLRSLGYVE